VVLPDDNDNDDDDEDEQEELEKEKGKEKGRRSPSPTSTISSVPTLVLPAPELRKLHAPLLPFHPVDGAPRLSPDSRMNVEHKPSTTTATTTAVVTFAHDDVHIAISPPRAKKASKTIVLGVGHRYKAQRQWMHPK
jgi:hypothetical protein